LLGAELLSVDASLLEEWERLKLLGEPDAATPQPEAAPDRASDITSNARAFSILVRNACWRALTALSRRDGERTIAVLKTLGEEDAPFAKDAAGDPWTSARIAAAVAGFFERHDVIVTDADARAATRVDIDRSNALRWKVRQTLSDPESELEWALWFEVDLDLCRRFERVVMTLVDITDQT
jgi:hypothetical protein